MIVANSALGMWLASYHLLSNAHLCNNYLSTHQRILFLPDAQYVNFTAAAHVEKDNEECSNPTQTTDNNEEAVMREDAGQFMAQN